MYHKLSLCFLSERADFACPSPRLIGEAKMNENFPLLHPKFKWGVLVYDGQMDDSRLLMETLLTSTMEGYLPSTFSSPESKPANVLNYARFDNFVKNAEGKIVGVEFFDKVNNKSMVVKAKHVINATGNFTDFVRQKDDPNCKRRIMHALGTHVILDSTFCSRDMGILIPKTSDGRVLFVVPWLQSTIVGTTDVIQENPAIHPTPTPECS